MADNADARSDATGGDLGTPGASQAETMTDHVLAEIKDIDLRASASVELVRELVRAAEHTLPFYNEDRIKEIVGEMRKLERSARAMVEYNRAHKLQDLRWTLGAALPTHIRPLCSESERNFANQYNRVLGSYTNAYEDLDLTTTLKPPKEATITVRVLDTIGEVDFGDGQTVNLIKGTQHLMRRADAELLIRQGRLEHVV
ncbi:uncharacterized protein MONBRDRAFT_32908 [Monosiga brevicollis MX1]|uniref:DNA replication complex GINS protein PSF1 C-terminal domain-containing protein n=1 Tax=Monosiga brevicollis TaxID=81824 RepID=A9V2G1_MONBE|nr:uncharacterized protein MONBRDRAFT_32908 [Monosiga brevicollis MX1]EDQ88369.1 predicted protein [Monosiga brevicollis MX1]|eukprot:XP_001746962.1 hypothetical protein [Monosiga brevicollis MX1]